MQNPFPIPVISHRLPLRVVASGIEGLQIMMVNVYFISHTDERGSRWFLVDAGLGQCAGRIRKAATYLFGAHARPEAILLTHGHFDHIGGLSDLLEEWQVPVYAHPMEMPYLNGKSSYPPPDPSVGGGAMALMAGMYPKKPVNLEGKVQTFPADGSIPGLPGWQVIHTPGHTAGHVSFFRERDGVLLAGDAFVTVKQESLLAVLRQQQEVHGPPAYFTSDWQAAQASVERLAALRPAVAACGHGMPMRGGMLKQQLEELARYFPQLAVPRHGRYVAQAARTSEQGVVELPPAREDPLVRLAAIGAASLAGVWLGIQGKKYFDRH